MAPASVNGVTSSLNNLRVSADPAGRSKPRETKAVADSWEDEADEGSDTDLRKSDSIRPSRESTSGSATRPSYAVYTPNRTFNYDDEAFEDPADGATSTTRLEKRPEKSTAVAARLIAAGIGQKAPRRTQEQRDYDRAMKMQEKKRRDEAREAEEKKKRDKEQAQKAMWDD